MSSSQISLTGCTGCNQCVTSMLGREVYSNVKGLQFQLLAIFTYLQCYFWYQPMQCAIIVTAAMTTLLYQSCSSNT